MGKLIALKTSRHKARLLDQSPTVARTLVAHKLRQLDATVLAASDLRQRRDPSASVPMACRQDQQVEGCRHLFLDNRSGKVHAKARHQHQAQDCLLGSPGVQRRQTAVVPRVHGLQHVYGLGPAHLANDDAIGAAEGVKGENSSNGAILREADYLTARSYLESSRRDQAFALFEKLSLEPSTVEGAEASYLIIQDLYDRGRFDEVEDKVYAFAPKAGSQSYWLAKAFIVLGDSFAEKGNLAQAKATFESVKNGYKPSAGAEDDVLDQIDMRLAKLNEMN